MTQMKTPACRTSRDSKAPYRHHPSLKVHAHSYRYIRRSNSLGMRVQTDRRTDRHTVPIKVPLPLTQEVKIQEILCIDFNGGCITFACKSSSRDWQDWYISPYIGT